MLLSATDRANEREVADQLARCWRCEVNYFGAFSPVDFWMAKEGRILGVAELKCRKISALTYPTVFLSLHKWMCLQLFAVSFDRPAYFVVRYTDGCYYIDVRDVKSSLAMGRNTRIPGSKAEPMIEVAVSSMLPIERAPLPPVELNPWTANARMQQALQLDDDDGRPWHHGLN